MVVPHQRAPNSTIKNNTTINWFNGICDAYGSWAGIIYLTHKSHFVSITGFQNLLSRAGDIELEEQQSYNNQPCVVQIRYGDALYDRDVSIGQWKSIWDPPSSNIAIKMEVPRGWPWPWYEYEALHPLPLSYLNKQKPTQQSMNVGWWFEVADLGSEPL